MSLSKNKVVVGLAALVLSCSQPSSEAQMGPFFPPPPDAERIDIAQLFLENVPPQTIFDLKQYKRTNGDFFFSTEDILKIHRDGLERKVEDLMNVDMPNGKPFFSKGLPFFLFSFLESGGTVDLAKKIASAAYRSGSSVFTPAEAYRMIAHEDHIDYIKEVRIKTDGYFSLLTSISSLLDLISAGISSELVITAIESEGVISGREFKAKDLKKYNQIGKGVGYLKEIANALVKNNKKIELDELFGYISAGGTPEYASCVLGLSSVPNGGRMYQYWCFGFTQDGKPRPFVDTPRPNKVAGFPYSDHNGAYSNPSKVAFYLSLQKDDKGEYDVYYFVEYSKLHILEAFREVPDAITGVIAGHGTQTSISLHEQGLELLIPLSSGGLLTTNVGQGEINLGDDEFFQEIGLLMHPLGSLMLSSCSVGKGKELEDNVANIAMINVGSVRVFSPTRSFCHWKDVQIKEYSPLDLIFRDSAGNFTYSNFPSADAQFTYFLLIDYDRRINSPLLRAR